MLLRDKYFHAAKILAVTHHYDLAAHVDVHLGELVEIVGGAVVGVDYVRFDVSGWRHAIEWHDYARIIVIRIALHVLTRWPMHLYAGRRSHIDTDLLRIVEPGFVFDDLGLQSRFTKFLRDIIRSGFVFRGTRHVRSFGQRAQMFLRKLWIWNGKKMAFRGVFRSRIAKAKNGGFCGSVGSPAAGRVE